MVLRCRCIKEGEGRGVLKGAEEVICQKYTEQNAENPRNLKENFYLTAIISSSYGRGQKVIEHTAQ